MRTLGVDLGSKRIGLAVSDEGGEIAFPAGILDSRGRKRDIAALRALIKERDIGCAVVGLPLHMDGRRGPEAEKATQFAADLARAAGIPVATLDERWTSMEAERLLGYVPGKVPGKAQGKVQGKRRSEKRAKHRARGTVDEMAASIILKTYLEQRSSLEQRALLDPQPNLVEKASHDDESGEQS